MTVERTLCFDAIAPGKAFHAALIARPKNAARGFQVTAHSHDFYEWMSVVSGAGEHIREGASEPMTPGTLLTLSPGETHAVRFTDGNALHYVNVAVAASRWERLADALSLPQNLPASIVFSGEGRASVGAAFARALVSFRAGASGSGPLALGTLAVSIGDALAQSASRAAPDALFVSAPPAWLAQSVAALRERPERLAGGIDELAALSGKSAGHLRRAVSGHTGLSVSELVGILRVERAATLLSTTPDSIEAIARAVGFSHVGYFYRVFRARFGVAPAAFRERTTRPIAP